MGEARRELGKLLFNVAPVALASLIFQPLTVAFGVGFGGGRRTGGNYFGFGGTQKNAARRARLL